MKNQNFLGKLVIYALRSYNSLTDSMLLIAWTVYKISINNNKSL